MALTDQQGRQEGTGVTEAAGPGLGLCADLVMKQGLLTRVWRLVCVHILAEERGQELGGVKKVGSGLDMAVAEVGQ